MRLAKARRRRQGGSAILEFTLTGIPLIFVWINIVQMSLGMWHYHTLQYAIKQAGAYVAVHGSNGGYCQTNLCRVQDAAAVMAQYAIGMPQSSIQMTFTPITSSINHTTQGTAIPCQLDTCQTTATLFPNGNPEFEIRAEYQFNNALGMVAAGGGGSGPIKFGNPWFPAYTHQTVLY
jgi:Flp pilus assembly protein TadG